MAWEHKLNNPDTNDYNLNHKYVEILRCKEFLSVQI